MGRNIFRGVAHTLEAVTSECSEFTKAWKRPAAETELVRHWEGEWRSRTNGHHGMLRCVLTRLSDGKFEAFFRAKYSRFLRACYRVTLESSSHGDLTHLRGMADLGSLAGGVYEYDGTVRADELTCTYRCKYDEGEFHLRPAQPTTVQKTG